MKVLGIVRKIDNLGRIVLPSELRRTMDFATDDPVEIFVDDDKIILKKYQPACTFCGSTESTAKFKDKLVCKECAKALSDLSFT